MKHRLWYKQQAANWEEALPVGNGAMGGMVYGGITKEIIELNHDTLWSTPHNDDYPNQEETLKKVRQFIFEEKYLDAEALIESNMLGCDTSAYQPLGTLTIDFERQDDVTNYIRELDLSEGIVKSEYDLGKVKVKQEVLASFPHQVIIVRYQANQQILSGHIQLKSLLNHVIDYPKANQIRMMGRTPDHIWTHERKAYHFIEDIPGGLAFIAQVLIECDGELHLGKFKDCCELTIKIILDTSYGVDDVANDLTMIKDRSVKRLNALNDSFDDIKIKHCLDYQSKYNRFSIHLGHDDKDLPTNERINRVKNGDSDPYLAALYVQYARYLLLSSSREVSQPANLQGIWSNSVTPPWNSDYTTNINTEMNYWLAEMAHLPECHVPLFAMLDELIVSGRITAQKFGCSGFMVNHNTDLWRLTHPVSGKAVWAFWPMAGLWLVQHLYEHYLYNQDLDFLRKHAYPKMKEAAMFCLDWLIEDENGHLVTSPSTSPENYFITNDGKKCSVAMAATMDMVLMRSLFRAVSETCSILSVDLEFKSIVDQAYTKLYPYKIGKYGQLQEWYKDFEEFEPGHRHLSHLYGLYPGNEILDEKLLEAHRVSLDRRLCFGSGHTGWSCAWIINLLARLKDDKKASQFVDALLGRSSYPNLFSAHPPFQIDGNFGGASGILELLLQSHHGYIEFLPALPTTWPTGFVKGMKSRGGFIVDFAWENYELKHVNLKSLKTTLCHVYLPKEMSVLLDDKVIANGKGHISFLIEINKNYEIR